MKSELLKLQRHFDHPSDGKLMNLMKRARPDQADENTRKLLRDITRACETCQTFSKPPERFTVSFPSSRIEFNREVALDLMWLEDNAVLHVVVIDTHFNAATFLTAHTVEPSLPKTNCGTLEQHERMDSSETAKREIATIMAELRIHKKVAQSVPRNAVLICSGGETVRIFNESVCRYSEPFKVIMVGYKQVFIVDNDGEVEFNICQVIPTSKYNATINGYKTIDTLYNCVRYM